MRQANTVGLTVQGSDSSSSGTTQILSTDFITEALTISDLFDLNEIASVELLMAGKYCIVSKELCYCFSEFLFGKIFCRH